MWRSCSWACSEFEDRLPLACAFGRWEAERHAFAESRSHSTQIEGGESCLKPRVLDRGASVLHEVPYDDAQLFRVERLDHDLIGVGVYGAVLVVAIVIPRHG